MRDVSTTSVLLNKPNWHMNYIAFHTQIQNEHRTFPPSQKKCTRIDIYTVDGNFSYVGKIPKETIIRRRLTTSSRKDTYN